MTEQTLTYYEKRKRIEKATGKNDPLHDIPGRLEYASIVLSISMVNEL